MTVSSDLDLDPLIADTEAEILRVIAGRRTPAPPSSTAGPLPHGPRRRRQARQAPAAAAGPPRVPVDRGRAQRALPGRRGRGDGPQLQPGPRRHPGRRARSGATGPRSGRSSACRRRSTPATPCSRSRGWRCTACRTSASRARRSCDLMRLYDETCLALCEGQYLDIATSDRRTSPCGGQYFDMIGRKTAALIAGSVQAGAMLATDDAAIIAAYRSFGWALGLAFQLNDDLLGIWGDEAVDRQGAVGHRGAQEDAAAHLRPGARRPADRARLAVSWTATPGPRAEVEEARRSSSARARASSRVARRARYRGRGPRPAGGRGRRGWAAARLGLHHRARRSAPDPLGPATAVVPRSAGAARVGRAAAAGSGPAVAGVHGAAPPGRPPLQPGCGASREVRLALARRGRPRRPGSSLARRSRTLPTRRPSVDLHGQRSSRRVDLVARPAGRRRCGGRRARRPCRTPLGRSGPA